VGIGAHVKDLGKGHMEMGMKLTGMGTSLAGPHIGLLQKGGKGQELLGLRPSLPDPSLSEKPGGLRVSLPYGPTGPGAECLGSPLEPSSLVLRPHLWMKSVS